MQGLLTGAVIIGIIVAAGVAGALIESFRIKKALGPKAARWAAQEGARR